MTVQKEIIFVATLEQISLFVTTKYRENCKLEFTVFHTENLFTRKVVLEIFCLFTSESNEKNNQKTSYV